MQLIKGIPVSPGVVIGRIFALDDERQRIAKRAIVAAAVPGEQKRLDDAIKASVAELVQVRVDAEKAMGADTANIFQFHIGMLGDKALIGPMRERIARDLVVAEYAAFSTFAEWANRFRQMKNSAYTTKANDLEDLSSRVDRKSVV